MTDTSERGTWELEDERTQNLALGFGYKGARAAPSYRLENQTAELWMSGPQRPFQHPAIPNGTSVCNSSDLGELSPFQPATSSELYINLFCLLIR